MATRAGVGAQQGSLKLIMCLFGLRSQSFSVSSTLRHRLRLRLCLSLANQSSEPSPNGLLLVLISSSPPGSLEAEIQGRAPSCYVVGVCLFSLSVLFPAPAEICVEFDVWRFCVCDSVCEQRGTHASRSPRQEWHPGGWVRAPPSLCCVCRASLALWGSGLVKQFGVYTSV